MEVYILDSLYRLITVIDQYESLIWTERFSAVGEFELQIRSTPTNRNNLVPGIRLSIPESTRVMTIETVEDSTDEEGRRILKCKGPSLEDVLRQRLAMADLTDLETDPKWEITDDPKAIAEKLFHDICVLGILDSGDIISGVTEGTFEAPDTIPAPTDIITYSFEPKPLYDALKVLCDTYLMGFRLTRIPELNLLFFTIYTGSDRTTAQTDLAAVIFSSDMDNLKGTERLTTNALYKNVAYVVSSVGHEVVYPDDVDPSVEGFERRVLYVNASDINDPDGPTASAQMIQRGKEELAKNRKLIALDGELPGNTGYTYGTDYNLGDLVELRDDDGFASRMQVTEQIFVRDKEGFR